MVGCGRRTVRRRCPHQRPQAPAVIGGRADPARAQGQLEIVQDLAGDLIAQRLHRGQDTQHPDDPGDGPGVRGAVPGLRRNPAQLRLGQLPQEGFRAFAVHIPSVPGPARRSPRRSRCQRCASR